MATRSLLKSHSNLTSQFLRKPFHLTPPIAQSTIIHEALRLPLAQKSQHPPPSPAFFLSDFVGANQKLLVGEEGSAVGGSFWARGRGSSSSSRKQFDSEEEFDDDDIDEFDDDDDDHDHDEFGDDMDLDGKFSEQFDDDDDDVEDEIDEKPKRRK